VTFKSPLQLVEFFGMCGQASNLLSLFLALIGTSFLVRKLGLKTCLFIFPAATTLVVLYIMFNPGLWSLFGALLIFRGITYGFNNPNKEILYIPTNPDVKFKAKGWIDVFGSRCSKAIGSGTNAALVAFGVIGTGSAAACLAILAIWLPLSLWVGTTNKKLSSTMTKGN
jgi:AAA family ATP:ADP antiporter